MSGSASWSFSEEDAGQMQGMLQKFLFESNARCALLVDRSGQLVATAGEQPTFDPTAFATLTAADFSANDQLARLIGETDFNSLFHQGEKESMYLADVARRVMGNVEAGMCGVNIGVPVPREPLTAMPSLRLSEPDAGPVTAPGTSCTSCSGLRPFSGSSAMRFSSTTSRMVALTVSTWATAPVTVTDSVVVPRSMVTEISRLWSASRRKVSD